MNERKLIEEKGNAAVKQLRLKKLKSGLTFMFNIKELSGRQCYLEYPNGTIFLVDLVTTSQDFVKIRELTQIEVTALKNRYNLEQ